MLTDYQVLSHKQQPLVAVQEGQHYFEVVHMDQELLFEVPHILVLGIVPLTVDHSDSLDL